MTRYHYRSLGWLEIHCIYQVGLRITEFHLPLPLGQPFVLSHHSQLLFLPLLFGNKSIWVFPFRNNSWSSPSSLSIPQLRRLLTRVLASVPLHLQHAHYTEIAAVLPNYERSYATHLQDQRRNNSLFPGCMLCIATIPLLMPPFLSSSALYSPLGHCSWSFANPHPHFY